jgi:hypothetical protein
VLDRSRSDVPMSFFDPALVVNVFVLPPLEPTRRIWLDDHERRCAVVDREDYDHFARWLWSAKPSRGLRKWYAFRSQRPVVNGVTRSPSVYLHVEILRRSGVKPPSPLHTIADHRNGNSLDCRKSNLRWATHSMNRRNLYGQEGYDLVEDVGCA